MLHSSRREAILIFRHSKANNRHRVRGQSNHPTGVYRATRSKAKLKRRNRLKTLRRLAGLRCISPVGLFTIRARWRRLRTVLPCRLHTLICQVRCADRTRPPAPALDILQHAFVAGQRNTYFLAHVGRRAAFFQHLASGCHGLLYIVSTIYLLPLNDPTITSTIALPSVLVNIARKFLRFAIRSCLTADRARNHCRVRIGRLSPHVHVPVYSGRLATALRDPTAPVNQIAIGLQYRNGSP